MVRSRHAFGMHRYWHEIKYQIGFTGFNFNFFLNSHFSTIYLSLPQLLQKMEDAADPNFEGAILASEDHLAYLNRNKFKKRVTNLASEVLFSLNLCIYFNKKSNLIPQVDDQLIRLNTYGFIEFWASKFIDQSFLKEPPPNRKPQKMEISRLFGGYQILGFGWLVGFTVFLMEYFAKRWEFLQKVFEFMH